jgi:hypothetical protein
MRETLGYGDRDNRGTEKLQDMHHFASPRRENVSRLVTFPAPGQPTLQLLQQYVSEPDEKLRR